MSMLTKVIKIRFSVYGVILSITQSFAMMIKFIRCVAELTEQIYTSSRRMLQVENSFN